MTGCSQPPPPRYLDLCHDPCLLVMHICRQDHAPSTAAITQTPYNSHRLCRGLLFPQFHELLRTTGLSEWTPVPLQFTEDENLASFLERDWALGSQ